MLEITNLVKKYKNSDKLAVNDISLTVGEGEVFGFLGPNGAGKSTTIKCACGILPFDSGSIRICGKSIKDEPIAAKKNIGYVSDNHALYDRLTAREYLNFVCDIYGVGLNDRKSRADKYLSVFGLTDAYDTPIRSYSHGMKQKICMMGSLVHDPALWILDEPMLGLDPTTINAVSEFMREYAAKGGAVLFSTHNLDAVRRICDRAIVIRGGLIEADMSVRGIGDSELLERFFLHGAEAEE